MPLLTSPANTPTKVQTFRIVAPYESYPLHKEAMCHSTCSYVEPSPSVSLLPPVFIEVPTEQVISPVMQEATEKQPLETPIIITSLQRAQSEIGSLEGEDEYSIGGFWCMKFLSWALTGSVTEDSPGALAWMGVATDLPAPGDGVAIDLMGRGTPQISHVGMIESIDADGTIHTIEGNTLNVDGIPSVNKMTRRVGDGYVLGFYRF